MSALENSREWSTRSYRDNSNPPTNINYGFNIHNDINDENRRASQLEVDYGFRMHNGIKDGDERPSQPGVPSWHATAYRHWNTPSYRREQQSLKECLDDADGWYAEQQTVQKMESTPRKARVEDMPAGDATIHYYTDDGEPRSIKNVNIDIIAERSPLIAAAFEQCRSGARLTLDVLTDLSANQFLRFLYTGSYSDYEFREDVPTSLLLHCQLYRLGAIFDLTELKSQAYVNILRQCEFGCCSADKPIELCAAIRFSYEHLQEHEQVTSAIVNYCVSCFLSHKLAQDDEFGQIAFFLRPFHQDLVKVCRDAGFEHESAMAIIRMPYGPTAAEQFAREKVEAPSPLDRPAMMPFRPLGSSINPPKRKTADELKDELFQKAPKLSALSMALGNTTPSKEQQPSGSQVQSRPPFGMKDGLGDMFTFKAPVVASKRSAQWPLWKQPLPLRPSQQASKRPLLSRGDSDFEVISCPSGAEVLSCNSSVESDSDEETDVCPLGTSVKTENHPLADSATLGSATADGAVNARDGESDSDWERI